MGGKKVLAEGGTRRLPPVLCFVTHIDNLSPFKEWNPPYNLENPDNAKARNILEAIETVAESLQLTREDCVPACLSAPANYYNIDAVVANMTNKLPESLEAQYLRILADGKHREKIKLLLGQLGIRRQPV